VNPIYVEAFTDGVGLGLACGVLSTAILGAVRFVRRMTDA
jgi:hypothetical protein